MKNLIFAFIIVINLLSPIITENTLEQLAAIVIEREHEDKKIQIEKNLNLVKKDYLCNWCEYVSDIIASISCSSTGDVVETIGYLNTSEFYFYKINRMELNTIQTIYPST